jgi:lipopolysaccharide/colanic/teichoic acid biosynthesis glycosyltransferase
MSVYYNGTLKRSIDLVVSTLALVALVPALAIVAIGVRIELGSPVLFRQRRPGLKGQVFEMIKFRTMRDLRNHEGGVLPDCDRLTRFGRFLRATSLDELPELWNVLRGDMSLVGPRPLLMQYLERYSPEQKRRHDVRPGITGLAQVNGRNALTWERKFQLDVEYVDRLSLWLDLQILALTVWLVVARKDINQPGHTTASEFLGTDIS